MCVCVGVTYTRSHGCLCVNECVYTVLDVHACPLQSTDPDSITISMNK